MTESQNALGKEDRFANVADAFRVINSAGLSGASVLVVDDILTTGATASEVARVLLRAGALTVRVLTLAVGVIDTTWLENKGRRKMDVRNCKRCGKIFNYMGSAVCNNCLRQEQEDFEKVREYLFQHPNSTAAEVSEAVGC